MGDRKKKRQNWYHRMSLQNQLFFYYMFLVLVPLILFGIFYYHAASGSILDMAKKHVTDITAKNVELVEKRLENIEEYAAWIDGEPGIISSLQKIGQSEGSELLSLDWQAAAILNKYFEGEDITSVYIITPKYTLGNNAQVRVPASQFYQSSNYKALAGQREKGIWLPTYSTQDEYQLSFSVEKPVVFTYACCLGEPLETGQYAVLLVNMNTALFRDIFGQTHTAEGSVYCISSHEGKIVAHTQEEKEGKIESLPWLGQAAQDGLGSMIVDYQGQKMVACYAASEPIGWIAATIVPVSSLLDRVSSTQYFIYGIGGILLAAALLLAVLLAQRITRPLEYLASAMKKTGEGHFSERLPVDGNNEIQFLIQRYNEMGLKIEKLIEENYKSELRNRESEIMALNLQLNPHFLYNTLNVVNLMALEKGDLDISKMVISVSNMMQYTFRNKRELVRMEEELEWLKNYTYIMEHRFEGKFQVLYEVEDGIGEWAVPKLLLEPLVENAIIHGFQHMDSGGLLYISCCQKENMLQIEIQDNGQGISKERLQAVLDGSAGRIGFSNVKKRLRLLYGHAAKMEIDSAPGEGCRIHICLPAARKEFA